MEKHGEVWICPHRKVRSYLVAEGILRWPQGICTVVKHCFAAIFKLLEDEAMD